MNDSIIPSQQPWWAHRQQGDNIPIPQICAVAYYRHSAQDRQENSVAIQQEQVQQWARDNNVTIIHEFADRGKSGLTADGRDAFNDMMENWVKRRNDFLYVLCLDVSRWGRFQDIDLSATYSADCKRHGKLVIYTTLGKPKENDQLYQVHVHFERYRAAQYSKELSDKVLRGCIKIAQQGFWAGGKPPYGLKRLLLDERRNPLQTLSPGQRKGIQNQRVTLAPGDEHQVAVVRRIFDEFVHQNKDAADIAVGLNRNGIASPGGRQWDSGKVRRILFNELYLGTIVYNKTTQKLKTPTHRNPESAWIKTGHSFDPLVDPAVFERAREIMNRLALRYTPPYMIEQLQRLFEEHGSFSSSMIRADFDAPSPATYAQRFRSLDNAYQQVFGIAITKVRSEVESLLRGLVDQVENYDDFLVVNRKFTVFIQPSVPIAYGYNQYWYFRPDHRGTVDITLGVPMSGHDGPQILGYLALPRLLLKDKGFRLFGSSEARLDMYGHTGLEVIFHLARS